MVNTDEVIVLTILSIFSVSVLAVGGSIDTNGSNVQSFVCDQPDVIKNVLQLLPTVSECTFDDDPSTNPSDLYQLTHQIKIDPTNGRQGLITDSSFSYETQKIDTNSPQYSFLASDLAFFTAENFKVEYFIRDYETGKVMTSDAVIFTDDEVSGTEYVDVTFNTPNLPDRRYIVEYNAEAEDDTLTGTRTYEDTLTEEFLVPGSEGVIN